MFIRIAQRLDGNGNQGFTLIELVTTIIIIGILLAIAVPSYLGFRDRSANNAAKANLQAALQLADAYYADHGTYAGMDTLDLFAIDAGVSRTLTVSGKPSAKAFCLTDTVSGKTWSVAGPKPSSADYFASEDCT
ncbi:MAG: type IV pilin protein [Gaiellaceae bacterium]